MQEHTPFKPIGSATLQDFTVWGNAMMRSSNKFDISRTQDRNEPPSDFSPNEETEFCAIGFACAMGIGNSENYTVNDSISGLKSFTPLGWNDYSFDVFGVKQPNYQSDVGNQIGYWIASHDWSNVDNSAKGAGQRVLYMIENGIPSLQDIIHMMSGKMPLCYTDVSLGNDDREKIDISKFFNIEDMLKEMPELESV